MAKIISFKKLKFKGKYDSIIAVEALTSLIYKEFSQEDKKLNWRKHRQQT